MRPISCLLVLLSLGALRASAQGAESGRHSFVELRKVGPFDVHGGEHIVIEDFVTDLSGTAGNYRDREFCALLKPRGETRWLVGGCSASEPGGRFNITGVRLPSSEADAVVVLLPNGELKAGSWMQADDWEAKTLAQSERVVIASTRAAPQRTSDITQDASPSFDLSILSVGTTNVTAGAKAIVPPVADVTVQADHLGSNSNIYLRVKIPYTDKCSVYAGTRDSEPGRYVFREVEFDSPGDPEQGNYSLVALAAAQSLQTGAASCATLPLDRVLASPTVQVAVDSKRRRVDTGRVPYITLTKIGQQSLAAVPEGRAIPMRDGDPVEVGVSERMTEGAMLTLWVRRRGSAVWLVNGPLLPRGASSAAGADGSGTTWVEPNTRLAVPGPIADESDEFEMVGVLSTAMFPNVWLDSTALSSHSIETISEIRTVRVRDAEPPSSIRLTISSVGGQEIDPDKRQQIADPGPVRVESREEVPAYVRVYVAAHRLGDHAWTVRQAMRNGKIFVVPDFPFDSAGGKGKWQLVAFPSAGALPVTVIDYSESLPHFAQTSELAEISYTGGADARPAKNLDTAALAPPDGASENSETQGIARSDQNADDRQKSGREKEMTSWWPLILFALVVLVLLEWLLGAVSTVCAEAAEMLNNSLPRVRNYFEMPSKVNPGRFLLGCALAGMLVWVLQAHYLRFYTQVIGAVTGLDGRSSRAWAMYLVVATAIAGVLIELSDYYSRLHERAREKGQGLGFFAAVNTFLYLAALVIWSYQATLYFEYFESSGRLIPLLAAMAAFLFSVIETLGFFFATLLVVDAAGWLLVSLCTAPFALLAVLLRLTASLFSRRPSERKKPGQQPLLPPRAAPDEPHFGTAAGD